MKNKGLKSIGWAIMQWRIDMKRCLKTKGNRLQLLIKWAQVVVYRKGKGSQRTLREIRAAFNRIPTPRDRRSHCWACNTFDTLSRHHIVQLQNGGNNNHLNVVKICEKCHAEIHPWLKLSPDQPINQTTYDKTSINTN